MDGWSGRGAASNAQAQLKRLRMKDLAPGGGDHGLMLKEKSNALGNMCNMQELKYAGCVAQF